MTETGGIVTVESWEHFVAELSVLCSGRDLVSKGKSPIRISHFLYRGHHSSDFQLSTTLERMQLDSKEVAWSEYYRLIGAIKPQTETFTGNVWPLEEWPKFDAAASEYEGYITSKWGMDAYSYMVYLRHHGFPSPLLDWSRSVYVAAYFAFRSHIEPLTKKVSIYVFHERPEGIKVSSSDSPQIESWGPYVKSHKRHFLQQGEYTTCSEFKNGKWYFVPHEKVLLSNSKSQDVYWRFDIPWIERIKVLKLLDNYNLNAFSLFDSEEALMETMSLRELTFKQR